MTRLLPFLAFLAGCVHQSVAAPTATANAPGKVRPRGDVPPLTVATGDGLVRMDPAGQVTERLSPTPARLARLLPDGDILFTTADGSELRRFDVETSSESVLAKLAPGCPGVGTTRRLGVDAAGTRACVVGASAELVVDIATGEHRCATAAAASTCDVTPPAVESPRGTRLPSRFEAEAVSPDGKWLVVGGNRYHGDAADRQLLLVEVRSGDARLVNVGAWPTPLTAEELDVGEVVAAGALALPAAVPVRWLAVDLFVAGSVVVHVGEAALLFPGEIAW